MSLENKRCDASDLPRKLKRCLREMGSIRYRGDIAKFMLEMENLHIHERVNGIA